MHVLVIGLLGLVLSTAAWAQAYPAKPIRIIVPFTPGGINDFAARSISDGLSKSVGVPVIVDNRPGAGGIVGSEIAAKSPPDGHTLIVGSVASHAIVENLRKNPPYRVMRDFSPVTLIAETPLLLVVHPSMPVTSVKELIRLGRRDQLNYASSGSGTATHLAAELFKTMTKTNLAHVPYKSAGPAVVDLVGGHITLMFATMPSVVTHVKSGKLRAIAVTSRDKTETLPEVPPIAKAGVADYAVTSWSGMFAPKGTPNEVLSLLAGEVKKILQTPASQKYFFSQGASAVPNTPAEFSEFVASEVAKWKKAIEFSGASAD